MAHFAKLNENNIVIEVNVVDNDVLDSTNEELSGVNFLINWSGGYSNWKQTSYNGNFRFNFAGIGFTYDEVRDAFIAPEPDNATGFNEDTCQWIVPKRDES
jgi:hypothetical protein